MTPCMQNILSIDISGESAVAVIAAVDGVSVTVLEESTSPFEYSTLEEETSSLDDESTPEETPSNLQVKDLTATLKKLLAPLQNPYTRASLIIPSTDYCSITLDLPFSDPKAINKILNLEVQDVVPVDVEEFHIQYQLISSKSDHSHNVHVSMLPREDLRAILNSCKEVDIEPYLVTIKACAASAIFFILSETETSAIIDFSDNVLSICAMFNSQVCYDRVINYPKTDHALPKKDLLRDIQITLAAFENKHQTKLNKIYLLSDALLNYNIQEELKDSAEHIELISKDLIKSGNKQTLLPSAAAIFAQDFNAPTPLTNFRSREFAYRPPLKALKNGIKMLLPYCAACLGIILLLLVSIYYLKEYRINATEQAIQKEIRQFIPTLTGNNEATIEQVLQKYNELEQELKNLNTNSVVTPLEAFALISSDLSSVMTQRKNISVKNLGITQDGITFKVETQDYGDIGAITRALKRRSKHQYCEIRSKDQNSSQNKISTFTLEFCKK